MKIQRDINYIMQPEDNNSIAKNFQIIDGAGTGVALYDFINRVYPHFNLKVYLEAIDDVLSGMNEEQPLIKEIYYNPNSYKLIILYCRKDLELAFQREFYHENNKRIVDHSYFKIPETFRRQGKSKPVFKESLKQYVNMDISLIRIHAALEDGGLVWGKFGFVAIDYNEMGTIIEYAKNILGEDSENFKDVRNIYDVYYRNYPEGRAFPMILWANMLCMEDILKGSQWHGELNLKNQEQYLNFENKCI